MSRAVASFYPIDRGVPIPDFTRGRIKNTQRRPWDELEVGDSFFVPGSAAHCESMCIDSAERTRPGKRFVLRSIPGGVRVWRVS